MANPERFLLAGVMGWPVMHSRSPKLHNYWFEKYGLAGTYVPLAVKPEGLRAALRALPSLCFSGCNLTIPHKQAAMTIVDEVDEVARKIGAISCVVVRPDGSLLGSNNDCYGFIQNILQEFPGWRADAGPAVVIGAGGGARAVVYGLAEQRRARNPAGQSHVRARAKARRGNRRTDHGRCPGRSAMLALADAAMLVNATSQGMVGNPPLDLNLAKLSKNALVADIVYIPRETPLLAAARTRGHRTINGLGMLLHQGRPAWKAWFGIEPEVTPELHALLDATIPQTWQA